MRDHLQIGSLEQNVATPGLGHSVEGDKDDLVAPCVHPGADRVAARNTGGGTKVALPATLFADPWPDPFATTIKFHFVDFSLGQFLSF